VAPRCALKSNWATRRDCTLEAMRTQGAPIIPLIAKGFYLHRPQLIQTDR
jgi:hypothetical protein